SGYAVRPQPGRGQPRARRIHHAGGLRSGGARAAGGAAAIGGVSVTHSADATAHMAEPAVRRAGRHLVMPGMAPGHSHAFQRALRGRTQRRSTTAGSFWTWRGLMFALAAQLDPEQLFNIARFAFVELAMSGVTAVGEFHYLHHDRGGRPYADRVALSEAVIQAAKAAGIRITLIRAAYMRAGYQQMLEPGQERFCDPSV